ncbi:MAG: hypothetical protein ACI9HK_002546 [Pirellulaceae bacterium]|jgi:hypothetical protein
MTQHAFLRTLFHPVLIACVVAFLLLSANLVPRVQCGIPVFLAPASTNRVPCNGVSQFGWPNTARVDEFIQYTNVGSSFHYSLNHLLGTQVFYVQRTRRSRLTHVANSAFILASVLLSALGVRAISNRKLSLKSLFTIVTLVGILAASFSWGSSFSISESLPVHWDASQQKPESWHLQIE